MINEARDLAFLRELIWDDNPPYQFPDDRLEDRLNRTATYEGAVKLHNNVYKAAIHHLREILANPKRAKSYTRGGISVTENELRDAIRAYAELDGSAVSSVRVARTYL